MYRILSFFAIALLLLAGFTGCASIETQNSQTRLRQNALFYVNDTKNFITEDMSLELRDEYLRRYFSVWQIDFGIPSKDEIFWGLNAKNGFGENKKPLPKSFFNDIQNDMQIDSYPSLMRKAIMIKTANVRVLPTIKPRFSSEGSIFDRWQNSLIFAWTPIIVLHENITKEWVLIQSSFVAGWVKSSDIAYINQNDIQESLNAARDGRFVVPLRDKIPLYHNDEFIENARIGMIFEINKENNSIYIYQKDLSNSAIKIAVPFDERDFAEFPLPPSEANIANIIDSIIPQNYGWGGMYDNRDCSAFIRDVFAPFGLWLPRNSLAQINHANDNPHSVYLALPESLEDKIDFLKQNAKPFRTIVWLQGHIMLYASEIDNQPVVIHDAWSINTAQGEQILGGIAITTLSPHGKNAPLTLLEKSKAIGILMQENRD